MSAATAAERAAARADRRSRRAHERYLDLTTSTSTSTVRPRKLRRAEAVVARCDDRLDQALRRVETTPAPAPAALRAPRATPRGLAGPGNGRVSHIEAPPEWRAPTVQVCGLFPWAVGGATPTLGVPLGRHMRAGTTVCFDPLNWFQRGRFLPNPSTMTLGLPGLGKSSITRRQVLGLSAQGVRPLVLGDLKPDYTDLVRAIGGQVVKLGRGLGSLNVLDVGALGEAAARLSGTDAERLRAEAHGRRLSVVTGLIQLTRGRAMEDYERSVLSTALRVLHERSSNTGACVPVLPDLVTLLDQAPAQVRAVTLDRGDMDRYRDAVDPLQRSLLALLDGPLGDVFARPTTERIALNSPGVAIDVSGISSSDSSLQAAVLLACWSEGFGAVEAANALADAGVAAQRHYFVILDELWRVLRSGAGMVDNVDALTRLNRAQGVAMAQITHTVSDMRSLANPEDVEKARGFVERAGAIICGGLPPPGGRRAAGDRAVHRRRARAHHLLVDPAVLGRPPRPARAGQLPHQGRRAAGGAGPCGPDPGGAERRRPRDQRPLDHDPRPGVGQGSRCPRRRRAGARARAAVSTSRGASSATGAGGDDAVAWLIPTGAAAAFVVCSALWVAGGLASAVAGHGFVAAPFALKTFIGVLSEGTSASWPGADPRLVAAFTVGLVVAVLGPPAVLVARWWLRRPAGDDPRRSLARVAHLRPLLPFAVAQRAQRLRPGLAQVKTSELARTQHEQIGLRLGRLGKRGPVLLSSWEDVLVALMAPRSGKTTTLAVPMVLSAPGAAVLTSNKTEGWAETAALRAAIPEGKVWTFDPQRIAHEPQTWWWNPLGGITTVREATRLAGHFVATVEGEKADIWGPAARELLANLILAAAISGHTMMDVYAWLADEATPVPRGLLAEHGFDLLANTLRGTQDLAAETRSGVYFTARAACACLRDDQITAWITPPAARRGGAATAGAQEQFLAEAFPTSRHTLYLLSKDEGGSAAPLVAALTDRVIRAGVAAAELRGGRLDPPMVAVLDEAANICRIADLPDLYSHLGSRGIVPVTILQSYAQGESVWGKTGAAKLWGAATVKLIGAGMDDADFAEDISRLVGEHEVATLSRSSGSRGGPSRTHATRTQRILTAAAVRELPKGSALLLATGTKPALVTLAPWYAGQRAQEIQAATSTAKALLEERVAAEQGRPLVALAASEGPTLGLGPVHDERDSW